MDFLRRVSDAFGRYMAAIVVVITALALFVPESSLWIQTGWINPLLMVVMFGMGLTLDFNDFRLVFTQPKYILLGCLAQFLIMPALAWGLSLAFSLDVALMAGVVLVGTCPGGTSSNVITYLSRGDVALSVITIGIVSVSRQAILFIIRNGNAILANHVPCVYVVCVRFAYRMGAHTVHGKHMTIVIIRMGGGSNAVLLFLRTSPIVLFGQSPQKFMIQRV